MDSLKTDNQLLIVNRSVEYRISKELIRKIPYFEKMFPHDLKESKVNKVVLDFDEKTFKIILDWIEMGSMYIKMDHVINLCTMVDYFGMNHNLIKDCFTYFHKNFSIEHLGTVMSQVTSTSKLVNSRALDAFICHHFLKIVNTSFWLKCHSATVLKICRLNVMISSEYQVFEAIIKWLRYRFDYRKRYFAQLLASIRWCNMDPGHLSDLKKNDLVRSADLVVETCSLDEGCGCNYDRTKQNYFITIEELNTKNLRIKVLDSNFFPLVNQVFKWDNSLPLFSLPDEHVSDVVFDSGRKMIRIDWKQEKCRLLNYVEYLTYLAKVSGKFVAITGSLLLEANGKLILLRISNEFVECWSDPKAENINSIAYSFKDNFIATILDKNMYILTEALDFMTFKIDKDGELKIIKLKRLKEQLDFDDLFLTSGQAHDKVFLVDKSTGNVYCFNITTQRWSQIGLLVNYNCCKTDRKKKSSKLLTFTSAFLSIDAIRPCLKRKLNSSN
uniref:BTB domain-containing protein n=1 Tax=Tetranychus urticae TaxID=32264 RepID=T1JY80_TETUR